MADTAAKVLQAYDAGAQLEPLSDGASLSMTEAYEIAGDFRLRLNYGLNRVRFPAPVVAGSEVRATCRLAAFDEADWGVQLTLEAVVESKGASKPCLAAEWIVRAYR